PSIALEVGYSQPYDSLLEDASLLLEDSDGRIGLVILVKLVPLKDNERTIQSGFVELYTYNKETHKRVKWKRRMVRFLLYFFLFKRLIFFQRLYPPPINHSRQKITLA
ncbi:hypothetical protein V8E54_000644, partial [Elaphomyces granulatus]